MQFLRVLLFLKIAYKNGSATLRVQYLVRTKFVPICLRPYHDEYTRSRLIMEVKHRRAGIVLG